MKKPQHTPGPWGLHNGDDYSRVLITPNSITEEYIATVYSTYDATGVGLENREANARLIAAAPQLLEALERAADELHRAQNSNGSQWLIDEEVKARAAIAKAKGK